MGGDRHWPSDVNRHLDGAARARSAKCGAGIVDAGQRLENRPLGQLVGGEVGARLVGIMAGPHWQSQRDVIGHVEDRIRRA